MNLAEHPTVQRFRDSERLGHTEPPRPLDAAWLRQLSFLASDEAGYITGVKLSVDGGLGQL